jgi:hypothetical protein
VLVRFLLLTVLFLPAPAWGHALGITHVTATFAEDGTYVVEVEAHAAEAGAAKVVPDLLGNGEDFVVTVRADDGGGGVEDTDTDSIDPMTPHVVLAERMLLSLFARDTPVRFDGVGRASSVTMASPSEDGTPVVRLVGRVPEGADIFRWHAPKELGLSRVTARTPVREKALDEWVEPGRPSNPLVFASAGEAPGSSVSSGAWVKLGFLHIVPLGADHILFVLGLFLFGAGLRPLLLQVTAFTAAHSVTLGLAMAGIVRLPAGFVEPLIALSVAGIALENLRSRAADAEVPVHRLGVVFLFGLLHGAGFAGALESVGVPASERFAVVLGFNVGVELGQLAVLLAAFVAVGWARSRPTYRDRVIVPGSIAIAIVGVVWTVQRTIEALG